MSQDLIELVQADLDGELTPSEQEKLREQLESDGDARRVYNEFRQMCEALETMQQLEPPADPARHVVAATRPQTKSEISTSFWANWFALPVLRYALAFVFGVVFASAVLQMRLIDRSVTDIASLPGTMAPVAHQTAQSFELSQEDLQGSVEYSRSNDQLQLHFALDSVDPVEVVLTFPADAFYLSGFAQDVNRLSSVNVSSNELILVAGGSQRFTVQLGQTSLEEATIELSFRRDGTVIDGAEIRSVVQELH